MSEQTLLDSLQLERLELNLFRGITCERGHSRIFGGQVIAQCLLAAYETVEDRVCHSLHAYFIRPGDPNVPIIFEVDRARDGGSFTTRRVVAVQHGEQIFNMAASFQGHEAGFEHQRPAPSRPDWRGLPDFDAQHEADMLVSPMAAQRLRSMTAGIDMRRAESAFGPTPGPPEVQVWCRATDPVGPDPRMHQVVLAYASDLMLLPTVMRPQPAPWYDPARRTASLDHAMWFHRPLDVNQWHLYAQDSPSASGGRGLARGEIYDEAGVLAASVAQEGMFRLVRTAGVLD